MKQDRFLIGILIGIVALIAIALVVFFSRQRQIVYRPEIGPEDVVHNYVLAVMQSDYEKAYGYLADLDDKPTYAEFRRAFAVGQLNPGDQGVTIGTSAVTEDDASVEVIMVYANGDPFSSGRYDSTNYARLVRQKGAWKIAHMPTYFLWEYSWYQDFPK